MCPATAGGKLSIFLLICTPVEEDEEDMTNEGVNNFAEEERKKEKAVKSSCGVVDIVREMPRSNGFSV